MEKYEEGNWRQETGLSVNPGSLCNLGGVDSSALSQRTGTEGAGVCGRVTRVSEGT